MNTIKIYSSKLGTTTTVTTSASTWGEFEKELVKKNLYNSNSMKAVDRESQTSLELPTAKIVDGMTVFLLPTKNDSGAISPEAIKEFVETVLDFIDALRDDVEDAAADLEIKTETDELREEAQRLIQLLKK